MKIDKISGYDLVEFMREFFFAIQLQNFRMCINRKYEIRLKLRKEPDMTPFFTIILQDISFPILQKMPRIDGDPISRLWGGLLSKSTLILDSSQP